MITRKLSVALSALAFIPTFLFPLPAKANVSCETYIDYVNDSGTGTTQRIVVTGLDEGGYLNVRHSVGGEIHSTLTNGDEVEIKKAIECSDSRIYAVSEFDRYFVMADFNGADSYYFDYVN